ncbi:MAG: response regulator [Acidobacteria bacterium]|nr:response regulator [Acidobacteriota bacterium]
MRANRELQLAVLAGFCGLLCNLLPYTLHEGVYLYWGGLFPILATLALGPVEGMLAAVISQVPAQWYEDHWLSLVTSVAEAALVGFVARRGKSWQHGEGVFWAALACPLLATGFYFALPSHHILAWANLLKGPFQSLLNVAAAVLLLSLLGERELWGHRLELSHVRTIRLQMLSGMIVAAIAPFAFLTMQQARQAEARQKTLTLQRLEELSRQGVRELDAYLSLHRSAVLTAAAAMEGVWKQPQLAGDLLARHSQIYSGMLTMVFAGPDGRIEASHPLYDREGKSLPAAGVYVTERDYFQVPKLTGKAFVSAAFQGRGFGADPIVAVSAPVRDSAGRFVGVVEGSLNLQKFLDWTESLEHHEKVLAVLIDQKGNTVFASPGSGLTALDPVSAPTLASIQDERRYLSRMASLESYGWKLLVLRPIGQFWNATAREYRQTALWTLLAILLAMTLVHFTGNFVNAPIEAVIAKLRTMPMDEPQPIRMQLPVGAPREIEGLALHLEIMSAGMAESYRGMRESLDERVRLNDELTRLFGELKQKATDLKLAKTRAEEANHAKTAFLTNISHEIRTPMNGLMGMLAILQESTLTDEQLRRVQLAQDSAGALLSLMNDMLTFAPGDGGESETARVEFVPATLIEGVFNSHQQRGADRGLQMSLYVDPLAKEMYTGDPARISQVLTQLLNNAIKFTHRGSIRVALMGKEKTTEGMQFRFEVSDTGIGVPEELQTHIFEPFTQADSSLTRRHGGTGIGLAVCKKIVSALGGEIGMRSAEGIGSVFGFQIPLVRARRNATTPLPAIQPAKPPAANGSRRPRVLIVEDNSVNQKVASRLVERGGFEYAIAENGLEALEHLAATTFDAILMDCQMPVLDGYSATLQIRKNEKKGQHIPIIAMTAHAMEGDRERCIASGMDDYLTKPVNRQELLSVLERWIKRPAAAGTSPHLPTPMKQ